MLQIIDYPKHDTGVNRLDTESMAKVFAPTLFRDTSAPLTGGGGGTRPGRIQNMALVKEELQQKVDVIRLLFENAHRICELSVFGSTYSILFRNIILF